MLRAPLQKQHNVPHACASAARTHTGIWGGNSYTPYTSLNTFLPAASSPVAYGLWCLGDNTCTQFAYDTQHESSLTKLSLANPSSAAPLLFGATSGQTASNRVRAYSYTYASNAGPPYYAGVQASGTRMAAIYNVGNPWCADVINHACIHVQLLCLLALCAA